jgi:hypothetical protein
VRPEGACGAPVGKAQIKWQMDEWVRIIRANQWETISFTAPSGSAADLIAIYSENLSGSGEFYADNASVTAAAVPEPSSGVLAMIAISASALWVRKYRARLGPRVGPLEPTLAKVICDDRQGS